MLPTNKLSFTDRCDYLASMNSNFGYVVAMEAHEY